MSNSVICFGERVSPLAPFLPRVVTIKPAFESFERDFLTNVGSAFTLSARVDEGISSPLRKPRAAMMCAATVNWTLLTDMSSPTQYVMLNSTIGCTSFFGGPLTLNLTASHDVSIRKRNWEARPHVHFVAITERRQPTPIAARRMDSRCTREIRKCKTCPGRKD